MNNRIIDISKDVKWIGIPDRDLVTFDIVMETRFGTTYNSYFIDAAKKAIVDTTKEKFWDIYQDKILQVCNPAEIEYIIVNHTEPDHSGNLKNLLRIAPNAIVVGSGNAIRYLRDLMGIDFPNIVVKDGHKIDLGNKTIEFISAPNLHWPDTMFSYLTEDQLLFTCDSFGAHYCDEKLFDDMVANHNDHLEAFRYYFDVIMKPYSKFMLKAIEAIGKKEIRMICTGHGPVIRSDLNKFISLTRERATEALQIPATPLVFMPFVSAYHKTEMIAETIAEGIREAGDIDVDVCNIEFSSLGELEEKISHASAYMIGSPTINQNTLLPVYKCFALINPIRDKGKLAASFGSYGWSGEAKKLINDTLTNLKLNVFDDGIFVKFTPNEENSLQAFEFGKAFGKKLLENNN